MKKTLSNSFLKIIACAAMLIDHIGAFLLDGNIVMRVIGRLAFPIFAFCIVEGWVKTKNKKKYIFRLAYLAFITELIYIFLVPGLNIVFTFLLGFLCIWFYELLQKSTYKSFDKFITMIIFFTAVCAFSEFFYVDYGWYGVATIFAMYLFRKDFIKFSYLFVLINLAHVFAGGWALQLFSVFAIFVIALYNGKRGLNLKWSFYIFYPLHLLVIVVLMFFV